VRGAAGGGGARPPPGPPTDHGLSMASCTMVMNSSGVS
jgi:hypothetical protein